MEDQLQEISRQICSIFDSKIECLTEKQAEYINLCNNSMNFYIKLKDRDKALWNARETLKYLKEITK